MAAAKLSFGSQGKSQPYIVPFNATKADVESDRPDHRFGKNDVYCLGESNSYLI